MGVLDSETESLFLLRKELRVTIWLECHSLLARHFSGWPARRVSGGVADVPLFTSLLPFIPIRMRPAQGLFIQPFALTGLYCPNLVPLLLVGWQSPLCKLTIASEYFAGMKPLATFRATINLISTRNKILLITPVVHILSHRRRCVLEQGETRVPTQKGSFRA